jgi:hypothetical protein
LWNDNYRLQSFGAKRVSTSPSSSPTYHRRGYLINIMGKKITEIPFWGVLIDCFPSLEEEIKTMQESEITNTQWLAIARWWRNALLTESDWSQVSDNSLTEVQRETWRQYREELRDITTAFTNPKDIVFPDLPK